MILLGIKIDLILRAYDLLDNDFNLPRVNIHLHKNIPFGSGLGGGSAMMMPSTFIFLNIFEMMRSNMKSVKHPLLELYVISFAYILIWTIFSIFATFLQYYLHNADMINMMGTLKHEMFAGIFLICAGVFQFSSLKNACLEKCRNPLSFIMGRKINNLGDVAKLGLAHGIFCLGCCWALMLLLFINGVMNLLWIVVLTIAVLAEQLLF